MKRIDRKQLMRTASHAAVACLMVAGLSACAVPQRSDHAQGASAPVAAAAQNKQTVGAFLGAVMRQDAAAMRALANEDYIQHNPYLPTGLAPFIDMLPVLKAHGTTAENVRMFQDGDYVFMHNIWRQAKPFGADEMVSFDVIRLDAKGRVAEHWDAMAPLVSQTASGRSLTDGPTQVQAGARAQTAANKALAQALVEDVLMGKAPQNIGKYISAESYHQHNPAIKDGLQGIMQAVKDMQAAGEMFHYTKVHKVLGEGDFVLTISEGQWRGRDHAFYDLFRIADGRIVEHWDVIQAIPTTGLANTNGMFGFR